MAHWTGEVSIMPAGRSYYLPPTFVTVEAGSYTVAVARAVREAKDRVASLRGRVVVGQALVKVIRVKADKEEQHG